MPPSPDLHLGWLLNYSKRAPVHLKPKGLQAHTAIIAQSGSGKSFTLGRLLEEIASKTQARVLILDPNSDFAKFSQVRPEAWADPNLQDHFASEDSPEEFQRRWSQVGFSILTTRLASTLSFPDSSDVRYPIAIPWESLKLPDKARFLGILGPEGYEELNVLEIIHSAEKVFREGECGGEYTLARHAEVASSLRNVQAAWDKHTEWQVTGWVGQAAQDFGGQINAAAAEHLTGRIKELDKMVIWSDKGSDFRSRLPSPLSMEPPRRVVCLDLGSLASPDERLLVAETALSGLWDKAREAWHNAMEKTPEEDERCPVFVVIDEAHNLGPAEPRSDAARRVNDLLVRIAAEGRKYGLFLILVTQRPSRLDASLLSQCDNLVLLKMNNRHDLDLVERVFGFVPEGFAKRAFDFKTGDALLAGSFVDGPTYAHVAPRRTQEGGRNVREQHWAQDPAPPTPPSKSAEAGD
jgi:hypothetical protein